MNSLTQLLNGEALADAAPASVARLVRLAATPIDPRRFSPPNPNFVPLPGSIPLPAWAAVLPPLAYYLALTLLPPVTVSSPSVRRLASALKFGLAALSVASFASLPFLYHVPGSAILSYQLGLVGCFGAARCLDIFFLSHPRVPRRIRLPARRPASGVDAYTRSVNESWPTQPHPRGVRERAWWALDLMISMRGAGWDFASPDVRHDVDPWQPPSRPQLHRALFKTAPVLGVCLLGMRLIITLGADDPRSIASLPAPLRPAMVALTGVCLYTLFDFAYTLLSALALPVFAAGAGGAAHNVDFFPLLNPVGLREVRSVRNFWSKAWHRLFHRAFLIYGVLPWQSLALRLEYAAQYAWCVARRSPRRPAPPFHDCPHGVPQPSAHADPGRVLPRGRGDWAKVVGAFFASGVVHAISERAALGGAAAAAAAAAGAGTGTATGAHAAAWSPVRLLPRWAGSGELLFFVVNGVAVVVEAGVGRWVRQRRLQKWLGEAKTTDDEDDGASESSNSPSPPAAAADVSYGRRHDRARRRGAAADAAAGATPTDSDEEVKRSGYDDDEKVLAGGKTNAGGGTSKPSAATPSRSVKDLHYPARRDSHDPSIASQLELELRRPWDAYVQVAWTLGVLLVSGEMFVDGWLASGIVRELTFAGVGVGAS